MSTPELDQAAAHRFFAAHCFNAAWDLLERPDRSCEETEQMLLRAYASLWHWTQRADCEPSNLSIGYWQVSRCHAVAGDGAMAERFGQRCLEASPSDAPFLAGYAHESLARAALVQGDAEGRARHEAEARRLAAQIGSDEERGMLLADLDSL